VATHATRRVSAVDLFCGAGGLSLGLRDAGISMTAGIDLDPRCQYPFMSNIHAPFIEQDVATVTASQLHSLWESGTVRVLAGCAPCQPFSSYRRGEDPSKDKSWPLLDEFGRLVSETLPDIVTMENVTRIKTNTVFERFVTTLTDEGYTFAYKSCFGPSFGLPQLRRRLILLASRLGPITVPVGKYKPADYSTVRQAIGDVPPLRHSETCDSDRLHACYCLSPLNLQRIRASQPGGTWQDWPADLRAPCHRRSSGSSFKSVYARMEWDKPGPTITTQAFNYGTGRFGHPDQDRAISLREAAILQGFPKDYRFVRDSEPVEFAPLGRLIGNAVPPPMARSIGDAIIEHVRSISA